MLLCDNKFVDSCETCVLHHILWQSRRYIQVYPMSSKYQAFDAFKLYRGELERYIKILPSNRVW